MIETDAGEFRDRDGQNGEINAGDAKAESQKADKSAGTGRYRRCHQQAQPRADAVMDIERRGRIGAKPDIERVAER